MYYQSQLLDQFFFNYKQGTSTVSEYLGHFKEEFPYITTSSFIKGLNFEIIHHDIPILQSLDEAYRQVNL